MSKLKGSLIQNQTLNINYENNMELESDNNIYGPKSQIDYKNMETFELKVILIGDSGVGKTSIVTKFITNEFKPSYQSTLGIEFRVKDLYIDNRICARLRIWDTCGQERFRAITRQYFSNSHGVLLVFDLTSKDSVKKLNMWLDDATKNVSDDCVIFVIGNKMDVKTRDISISEEAKNFANDKKLNYYEVSAKTGNGIINIFEKLARKMINNIKKEKNEENIKTLNRHLNIEDFSNKDRGKVENRSRFHCC